MSLTTTSEIIETIDDLLDRHYMNRKQVRLRIYLAFVIGMCVSGVLVWNISGLFPPKLKSFTVEPKAPIEKKLEFSKGYRP